MWQTPLQKPHFYLSACFFSSCALLSMACRNAVGSLLAFLPHLMSSCLVVCVFFLSFLFNFCCWKKTAAISCALLTQMLNSIELEQECTDGLMMIPRINNSCKQTHYLPPWTRRRWKVQLDNYCLKYIEALLGFCTWTNTMIFSLTQWFVLFFFLSKFSHRPMENISFLVEKIPNKLTHQICTSNFLNKLPRQVFTVSVHVFESSFYLIWNKRTLCAFRMAFMMNFWILANGQSTIGDNHNNIIHCRWIYGVWYYVNRLVW